MDKEMMAAVSGAVAGGVVSLAIEGVKSWLNRRRAKITASLCITGGGGKISHYTLDIRIVNTGGETMHVVRYGIKGPTKLNSHQRQKQKELQQLNRKVKGLRGWLRRVDVFETGILVFNEVIVLAPGQPHTRERQNVCDWIGVELNQEAIAFAEDSFGRVFTCRFNVPHYESLVKMRTPEEQEEAQRRVSKFLRVDTKGYRIAPDSLTP